jgi:hypothetical protein
MAKPFPIIVVVLLSVLALITEAVVSRKVHSPSINSVKNETSVIGKANEGTCGFFFQCLDD